MAPTVYNGREDSYTAAVTVVRHLENYIDNFSQRDYPLLQRVGMESYGQPVTNTKVEWQRDEDIPITDALNGAVSSTTDTQITVDNAEYFTLHEVILCESELMQVVGTDPTNDTLTVIRGFAGSTAATHDDNDVVYRLGSARPEGSSPGWSQQTAVTQPYNYTQIWDGTVSITGTEDALQNHGVDDLMAYRLDKRMAELYQMMEQALINANQRYVGTASLGRMSAGLAYFVADTNDLSTASFTFDAVEDAMQDKFEAYGMANVPDSLWVNAWAKRRISAWGVGTVRTDRTENVVGNEITVLETNFGVIDVVLDHLVGATDAWLLNLPSIQMASLQGRGFKEYDASVAGDDARKTRVLGEYIFIIKGEDGTNDGLNVKIYNFSSTS